MMQIVRSLAWRQNDASAGSATANDKVNNSNIVIYFTLSQITLQKTACMPDSGFHPHRDITPYPLHQIQPSKFTCLTTSKGKFNSLSFVIHYYSILLKGKTPNIWMAKSLKQEFYLGQSKQETSQISNIPQEDASDKP